MRLYYNCFLRLHFKAPKSPPTALNAWLKSCLFLVIGIIFFSQNTKAQKLEFSYSYLNVSRANGGGTLEQGDTIEVHALVKVNAVTKNFYYIDTIPAGMNYVDNSMRIVTNENLTWKGPFTSAYLDDYGVYTVSGGVPRLRINLGVGATFPDGTLANFGVNTGGGTVTPGNVPKFYGQTLFVVAYQLKITANFGDTIHLTGNYYIDTANSKKSYRFNYPGIKIIQNQSLCNNFSSASFTADSSFGFGTVQNRVLPAIVPGYTKVNLGANAPQDNYYSIANNTSADGWTDNTGPYVPTANAHRVFNGYWDIIGDHTDASNATLGNPPVAPGTKGGYMLVVNAAYPTGEAYRDTIKNLCPNTYYEFSAWFRNICGFCGLDSLSKQSYKPGVQPNMAFTVNDIDYFTTGNIPWTQTWVKRGFIYKTGPSETQFAITIKNNAAGGGGNDWVMDDIKLATCYPNLIMNPRDTAKSCAGNPVYLSDTVRSFFNNYVNYCWEKSTDNGVTWANTGSCGTKVPTLVNGLWQYIVDTVFTATATDSGTFYRLKVATTLPNLNDSKCSVDNSQKVFLKIYNVNCIVLNAADLNFKGKLQNERALLTWTGENDLKTKSFELQKSSDGINFYPITNIPASLNLLAAYSYLDPDQLQSKNYYRIRLISNTNEVPRYSQVIALFPSMLDFRMNVVNPFRSILKIETSAPSEGNLEINLCDTYGKVIIQKIVHTYGGSLNITLDEASRLSAGIYILRIQYNGKVLQQKLFKL